MTRKFDAIVIGTGQSGPPLADRLTQDWREIRSLRALTRFMSTLNWRPTLTPYSAVGARALIPEMPGIDEIDYLTNSGMMHVDFLPKHLVIIAMRASKVRARCA